MYDTYNMLVVINRNLGRPIILTQCQSGDHVVHTLSVPT